MTTAEQATVSLPKNTVSQPKRKIKLPLALKWIQWIYPKTEALAPQWAYKWFVKLFFSPPRYPIPDHEQDIIRQAKRFTVLLPTQSVKCYSWGEGPAVLFVHGWAGRASQFKTFITSFTQSGYQVISFDAPAHGLTKGKQTTIIEFKDVILELEKKFKIQGIVAHSLGGGASLFALSEGLKVNKLITIATPTIADEILNEFASRINASYQAINYFKKQMVMMFNRQFHEVMSDHFVTRLKHPIDWLIIHDEDDKEVSLKNADRLHEVYPSSKIIKTSGLGHGRILRDEKVIQECLKFIGS